MEVKAETGIAFANVEVGAQTLDIKQDDHKRMDKVANIFSSVLKTEFLNSMSTCPLRQGKSREVSGIEEKTKNSMYSAFM